MGVYVCEIHAVELTFDVEPSEHKQLAFDLGEECMWVCVCVFALEHVLQNTLNSTQTKWKKKPENPIPVSN